jgi:hypothetical protein
MFATQKRREPHVMSCNADSLAADSPGLTRQVLRAIRPRGVEEEVPVQERKRSLSLSEEHRVAETAGVTPEIKLPDDVSGPQTPATESRTIVFCDDAEQVSAGFALALNLMETNADLLMIYPEQMQ